MKDMREKMNHSDVKTQGRLIPYMNKPGIAFSFDDSFRVNDWCKYGKDIFGYYDVKVTFNINAFHHFENQREHTQKEIDMLLELQSNGHEMAHHTFKHRHAARYSSEVGLSRWIEDDIIPLFSWMEKQSHSKTNEKFKRPVTFAFPYFNYNDSNIMELLPKYFKVVRGHLHEGNVTPFNHTGFAPSLSIDANMLSDIEYVKEVMKIAKQTGSNLILTCHSILPEEVIWEDFGWGEESVPAGKCRISPEMIQAIINEARKNELEFYTTSEIAGVATFIDRNFEKCVRELISNPTDRWIAISELSLIKELDISNKNISNLDGIQYFLNLEKLNLSNNNISDVRLLEKLTNLKEWDISNNPIKKQGTTQSLYTNFAQSNA